MPPSLAIVALFAGLVASLLLLLAAVDRMVWLQACLIATGWWLVPAVVTPRQSPRRVP